MKKKTFRSLAALALSAAVVMSLGACSNNSNDADADENVSDGSDEEKAFYVDVKVGDVLYSDDNCSVTIKSLETNDDGGSTLTLSLVSTYDTSVYVGVNAYDTEKYDKFVAKEISTVTGNPCDTCWIFTSTDDTETDAPYDFSDEYVYFDIEVNKYDEMLTDEQLEDGDYSDIDFTPLYSDTIKISTEE